MKRFYIERVFSAGEIIDVPGDIVKHIHVLRLKLGETIELFDGKNQAHIAEIVTLEKRNAVLKILTKSPPTPEPRCRISLAAALIANDKMDLIIQKAVELGINHIIPLYTERSARLPADRCESRLKHWQNIIISSCCQCGQNLLPTINLPIPFNTLFVQETYDLKIIMSPGSSPATKNPLPASSDKIDHALILTGPEGGFSEDEIKLANSYGYCSLQLGNLIMRSETAVIAGLSALNLYLNKWNL